jgi:ABC-type transport system substrate-binding protein
MTLLVAQEDPVRVEVANMAADWMRVIGLDVKVESAGASELMVRVFDSGQFDMTILGWRLARVPSYLCDWFGAGNFYGYHRIELTQHCAAFGSALDLDVARQEALVIESLLAQDLPLAPLYSEMGYDLYAGVTYPFEAVLDGLTGIYGAPWLAIPVLP